jgi:HAD superfamily hydrolase (TIGR01490 family)
MDLALFDLDNTLLNGDSDHAWGQFLADEGLVDAAEHTRRNNAFWEQYKDGTIDFDAYLRFALATIAGKSDEELVGLHERFMRAKIESMITTGAAELVRRHADDLCAIVTATNTFVTKPIARRLGVDTLIGSEAEQVSGRYTGAPTGIMCFREGKIQRVEKWLAETGSTIEGFRRSWFYSDSFNDLPLLQRVTHPVAVAPDARLRAVARERGWPILETL